MSAPSPPAPPNDGARLPYLPALDGLRGIAVAAVLLFHADLPFLHGGHLGVTVFFTLSGFLITSLLLLERQATGGVDLRRFWGRRARRLVPAMLLVFPLVALVVHTSATPAGDGVLWDGAAALAWVANWRFVLDDQTYADLFSLPSPFQHFWSLAVEEQFYVVFPLLLVLALGTAAAKPRIGRLTLILGVLTLASTIQVARLYSVDDFSRAYYGTDGRIAELLVGSLLAVALVRADGWRQLTGRSSTAVNALGVAGLLGLALAFVLAREESALLYRGGFLFVAVCTAAVLASIVQPRSLLARPLSTPPLVLLGIISYGVYLFHWPVFLMVSEDVVPRSAGEVLLLQLGVTFALAFLSYVIVERPVRYGVVPTGPALAGWAGGAVAAFTALAVGTGAIPLPTPGPMNAPTTVAGGTQRAAAPQAANPQPGQRGRTAAQPQQPQAQAQARQRTQQQAAPAAPARAKRRTAVPAPFLQDPKKHKVAPVPHVPAGALKVVMVGDSIGDNLGSGLRSWAQGRQDVVVYNLAVPACPLSRGSLRRLAPGKRFDVDPVCGWWDDPGSERRKAFEQFDPDVVVVQDGINEIFDRKQPDWDEWRSPGHPQYDSWLYDEYRTAFNQWALGGAEVVVTNTPCGDFTRSFQDIDEPELRIQSVNLTYSKLPQVTQADLFQRVCPGGRYSDTVEGISDARPDGFHFRPEAAAALARNWLGPLVLQAAKSRTPLQPPGPA